MDPFFRAEALRGTIAALRSGKTVEESIADGVAVCEIAVKLWNAQREWQVHRSNCFADTYVRGVITRFKNA